MKLIIIFIIWRASWQYKHGSISGGEAQGRRKESILIML